MNNAMKGVQHHLLLNTKNHCEKKLLLLINPSTSNRVKYNDYQLMEIGQNGVHGHHAVQLAEKERRQGLYTTFVFSIN